MIKKLCALLIVPFMLTLNCPLIASEISQATNNTSAEVTTDITYDPATEAIAGQRIPIQIEVEDKSGVDVVRIYFRVVNATNYFYVTMNQSGDTFTAILPAPANGAGEIDYLILVKNNNNQLVKSQNYMMTVVDDNEANASDLAANNEKINIYTEAMEAPGSLEGFMDNIAIHLTKSAVKYGVTMGIYSALEAGASTSSVVASGTVTAATGGMSTTMMVVSGVGAAAAVGGVAVAAGGSSSSDGGTVASSSVSGTTATFCGYNYPYCDEVGGTCVSAAECSTATSTVDFGLGGCNCWDSSNTSGY